MPGERKEDETVTGTKRKIEDGKDDSAAKQYFVSAVECGFLANVKSMIEDGTINNVASIFHNGNPILSCCVKSEQVTEYLLSHGAIVNGAVVGCAVQKGTVQVLGRLLEKQDTPDLIKEAFDWMLSSAKLEMAQWLIATYASSTLTQSDIQEMLFATFHRAYRGFTEPIVKSLIVNGADVNLKNDRDELPLNIYLKKNCLVNMEVLRLLVPNSTTLISSGAIHQAVQSGNVGAVMFLLEKGASVDERDNSGKTPLHYATSKYIAIALVKAGADLMAIDHNGTIALALVCSHGEEGEDICASLLMAELNRTLLQTRQPQDQQSGG